MISITTVNDPVVILVKPDAARSNRHCTRPSEAVTVVTVLECDEMHFLVGTRSSKGIEFGINPSRRCDKSHDDPSRQPVRRRRRRERPK